jgi:hypothetical protein
MPIVKEFSIKFNPIENRAMLWALFRRCFPDNELNDQSADYLPVPFRQPTFI